MRVKTKGDNNNSSNNNHHEHPAFIGIPTEDGGVELVRGRKVGTGKFSFSTGREITQEWLVAHFVEGDVIGKQNLTILRAKPRQLGLGIQCMLALPNTFLARLPRHRRPRTDAAAAAVTFTSTAVTSTSTSTSAVTSSSKGKVTAVDTALFAIDLKGRIVVGPVNFPEEAAKIAQAIVERQ